MSVFKPAGYDIYLVKLQVGRKQQRFPGVHQLGPSQSIERHLKRLIGVRAGNDVMPSDLAQWLLDLPQRLPNLYTKLCDCGLLSRSTTDARRPLSELLYGIILPKKGFDDQGFQIAVNTARRSLLLYSRKPLLLAPNSQFHDLTIVTGGLENTHCIPLFNRAR